MRVRLASPDDPDDLLGIWLRSVRATHDFLSEDDIQDFLPRVRDRVLKSLELWVLVTEPDTPIGFMALHHAKVEALFLDPAHLRQGGGTLLIAHARREKGRLRVDVNEQNLAARRFYEALGFVVHSRSDQDPSGRCFPLLHLQELPAD